MTPIRRGDGTGLKPQGIAEVRKGDGTVLWLASDIPNSGLIRYEFEENLEDSWNDNDGSLYDGSDSYTTDSQQGSYSADFGSGQWTVEAPSFSEDWGDGLTVCFWLYAPNIDSGTSRFPVRWEGEPAVNFRVRDPLRFEERQNNNQIFADISEDTWYHICGRFDGSSEWELLVDNSSEGTASASDAVDNGGANTIGSNSGSGYFDGYMDDFRLYNKKLSDSEIQDIIDGNS